MNFSVPPRFMALSFAGAVLTSILTVAPWSHAEPPAAGAVAPATVQGSVHSIQLASSPHEMPAGPNLDVYNANCAVCHSTRYVTMQPKFTRKTWEAEVTKMANVYGAPVAPEQQKLIVDYLMSIRGKEDAPNTTKTAGGDSSAKTK